IPDHVRLLVVSYEGVHEVVYDPAVSVRPDTFLPEGAGVFHGKSISYHGTTIPTLGHHGGEAILVNKLGEVLDLKAARSATSGDLGAVEIWGPDGELVQSLPFEDYSGDWQQVTFSTDYRHIVIGTPYTITLYRRE